MPITLLDLFWSHRVGYPAFAQLLLGKGRVMLKKSPNYSRATHSQSNLGAILKCHEPFHYAFDYEKWMENLENMQIPDRKVSAGA